jgi:iron complex outermembrane recepter protein
MKNTMTKSAMALAVAAVISGGSNMAAAFELEEVIVTAQKRSQNLMDVPISVSAVSGEKIGEMGIQRAEDITSYVPNFQVVQGPIGDRINIRGIQTGNDPGFEQSVATFVDGIYRGRAIQSRFSFLDVEMVEVLRGPQPTLFGKNTVAGAVNIRSARPTADFEGEVSAGYNPEFDETELQGVISGPLTDTLRGRLVLMNREMDEGWVNNFANDQDMPVSDELFGRLSLEWDVSDSTQITLRHEQGDWEIEGHPWVFVEAGPLAPFLSAGNIPVGHVYETHMGQNGFGTFAGDSVLDFGSNYFSEGSSSETSLTVTHDLPNGSTITAIAGHSEYDYERFTDADFSPLPLLRFDDTEDFKQTSFELRLASDVGGDIEYVAGLYYQENDLKADGLTQFNLAAIGDLLGGACAAGGGSGAIVVGDAGATTANVAATVPGSTAAVANACGQAALTQQLVPAGVNGASRYHSLEQSAESWAVFAQPTWNISEEFRATLGLRYTEEEKSASQLAYATDYVERTSTAIADPTSPAAGAAYLLGEFTPHNFTNSDPGMSRDEESFTWSFNVQYDVTQDTMVYATAGTGFKAGGFNSFYMGQTNAGGADSTDVGYDEEEVFTYELGFKMSLLDGGAELNVAAFRTEYDDLQVSVFSGNTTFLVQNAAEAISQGIEIDGRWQATEKLMLLGSLGYVDFKYDNFQGQACVSEQVTAFRESAYQDAVTAGDFAGAAGAALTVNNQSCSAAGVNDLSGKTSENTPELSASLSANYVHPLGDNFELTANLDASYTDETYRQSDLDPVSQEDDFWKFNMLLSIAPTDGSWDVSLVGKNITDEETLSYVNDAPLLAGTRFGRIDAPRSFTIRGRYRF